MLPTSGHRKRKKKREEEETSLGVAEAVDARAEPRAVWVCSGIVVCRRILNLARLPTKKRIIKIF